VPVKNSPGQIRLKWPLIGKIDWISIQEIEKVPSGNLRVTPDLKKCPSGGGVLP
jgi:hypothetical protein